MFEYESEDLHTPISSDDEGRGEKFPEFNDEYAHDEGRFELGTRFATVDRFKEVVKDSFIAEGREVKWIKNDKERVRVGCGDKECPYLVHLSYNKSLGESLREASTSSGKEDGEAVKPKHQVDG